MIIGFTLLLLVVSTLFSLNYFQRKNERRSGWRLRKSANGNQVYSEYDEGIWKSIEFITERYSKRALRHAIIIPKKWNNFPDWAQEKKDIIIIRISEKLKHPEYTIIFE